MHRVKRHPALKHGAYSATAVLPGESQAAFEKLHRDLIAELTPSGVLEDDIVMTIARLLWRKQNLRTQRIAELALGRFAAIKSEKLDIQIPILGEADPANHEENLRIAEDCARDELGAIYKLVELGQAATFDGLAKELEVEERLDALIDRCLKRLLHLRGLKSISAAPSSTSPTRIPGPPKAA